MNQRDEQRVIEALRAYTGGLIVTEQDILTANGRLRSSLEPPNRRRRPLLVAAAAVFVLIAGLVAYQAVDGNDEAGRDPAPATPSSPAEKLADALEPNAYAALNADFTAGAQPTARDLNGIWLLRPPYEGLKAGLVINGKLDWSYHSLRSRGLSTSTLDGRTWTRNLDRGPCVGGGGQLDPLPWTVSLAGDGSLHLLFQGSQNVCTPAENREVWDRLVPGPSPVMDYLREATDDIDWVAPTDSAWYGLYINVETGHVLDVASNGSYSYFDSVTGEEFTPTDEGLLQLGTEPGTIAGTCDGGGNFSTTFEAGVTEAVPDYLPAQNVRQVAASGGACSAGIGAGGVWFKLV